MGKKREREDRDPDAMQDSSDEVSSPFPRPAGTPSPSPR